MQTFKWLFIGIGVLVSALVILLGYEKSGTVVAIGRQTVIEKIENIVGEFKVKQAESKAGVFKIKDALGKLQEGRIKTEVQLDLLVEKENAIIKKIAKTKTSLGKIRNLIDNKESAIIAGRQYAPAELQQMANDVIVSYEALVTQLQGIDKAKDLLNRNINILNGRLKNGKARVAQMDNQLNLIEAKIMSLNIIKDASEAAGDNGLTLAGDYEQVQDQLNALYTQVETGLRIEDESWDSYQIDTAVEQLYTLESDENADSIIKRIDAVIYDKDVESQYELLSVN